jgi:hypothetical protein
MLLLQLLHHLPAAVDGCVSVLACCCLQGLQLQQLAAPAAGVCVAAGPLG